MTGKKFGSIEDWLNDLHVRRAHGVSNPDGGVLQPQEIIGPHDIGSDQRSRLRPRPSVKVGYIPSETVLWTAVWEIPVDVDLSALGLS